MESTQENLRKFTFHFYCPTEEKYESLDVIGPTFADVVADAHTHRHNLWHKTNKSWKIIAAADNTFWNDKMEELTLLQERISNSVDIKA